MFATIRTGARLFKATVQNISKTKKKITKTVKKIWCKGEKLARSCRKNISSFFSSFRKRSRKKPDPILMQAQKIQKNEFKVKKTNKSKQKKSKPKQVKNTQKKPTSAPEVKKDDEQDRHLNLVKKPENPPIKGDTIENFYQEWEANWGPALTRQDREFLESASPEVVAEIIANARMTLKSPYLKAVYNGLKDLQEISDLIENDRLAKEKVMPTFKDYLERRPDEFCDFVLFMHDKGVFPTRSGERSLSLDPRLIPGWLGLAS